MRYEKRFQNKTEKTSESNKEILRKEKQKRLEEKHRTSSVNRWKQLNAKVISSPTNVCTIQRTKFIQEEVTIKCSILGASEASIYTVRFIHKRTLQFARTLRAGDFISLEECRFSPVAGRSETEILVKRASRINAHHP
jgi:hypothetical protein